MQFLALFVMPIMASTASAAPSDPNVIAETPTRTTTYCYDKQVWNQVSMGSPTVKDCKTLIDRIRPDAERNPGWKQEALY
ncbi:hypothetical protein QBC44DRAFT_383878 [Cladorrhinum sp. PSN332]|nr:hypothetical protein QBC44DRAFT_383878 [Cladorrhinum sp. PSN332]